MENEAKLSIQTKAVSFLSVYFDGSSKLLEMYFLSTSVYFG